MRAAFYDRVGPAAEVLQVGELPTPEPGPGEVRVRVACSGVNPSDVKTRGGVRSATLPFARIVPHSDGAGTIDAVGAGVDAGRVGQRVWVWNAAWGRPMGTAAEFVVLPAAQAVELPGNVSFEVGACLGIPALTAWQAVAIDGGVRGKRVLVAGAAGAVGHCAVQMAKQLGAAQVIASVSSAQKAAIAREAGADAVVDYKTEALAPRCLELTGGAGVDRVIEVDLAANVDADIELLRPDGEIVVYGSGAPKVPVPFFPSIVKNVRYAFFMVYHLSAADRARALQGLDAMLRAGSLQHRVAATFGLAQIARAHEAVEQGRLIGNVVVNLE